MDPVTTPPTHSDVAAPLGDPPPPEQTPQRRLSPRARAPIPCVAVPVAPAAAESRSLPRAAVKSTECAAAARAPKARPGPGRRTAGYGRRRRAVLRASLSWLGGRSVVRGAAARPGRAAVLNRHSACNKRFRTSDLFGGETMDFQKRLEKAIERGYRTGDARADAEAHKSLGERELRRLHTQYRLELSEHIEHCLRQVPEHLPGFDFETVASERGWGAAVARDDIVGGRGVSPRDSSAAWKSSSAPSTSISCSR